MKKLIYSLFIVAAIGISACSNPSKKLLGNWVVSDAKLELSKQSQQDSNMLMMSSMMEAVIQQMKNKATMEFKEKGKLNRAFGGQLETGTWELTKDGKKLVSSYEAAPKKDTADIEFVDDKTIKLTSSSPEAKFILTLSKKTAK
jgi:hypothetical protein